MTALARQLQAGQHDVVFLYSSGATGLPFVRSPDKDHIIDNIRVASKLPGDDSLEFGRPKREGVASIQRTEETSIQLTTKRLEAIGAKRADFSCAKWEVMRAAPNTI